MTITINTDKDAFNSPGIKNGYIPLSKAVSKSILIDSVDLLPPTANERHLCQMSKPMGEKAC